MEDRKEPPVIDLVPKRPFSWKVVSTLIAVWVAVLILAIYTRHGLLRLLLPLIIVAILGYVVYCAVRIGRRRR